MKKTAFTLAETLITLAIIGVVAAITIPSLVQKIDDQQYKTAYKKAFSVASSAMLQGVKDNAFVARDSQSDAANNYINWNAFKAYFKISKDCSNNNNSDCWDWTGEESNGAPISSQETSAFIDNSGMAWSMRASENNTTTATTSMFLVDTNGFKAPNKYGKDRWILRMNNNSGGLDGTPIKIGIVDDIIDSNVTYCPSGRCYYKSWLTGAQ